MKDHFSSVKEYFVQSVLPCVRQLLEAGEDTTIPVYNESEEDEYVPDYNGCAGIFNSTTKGSCKTLIPFEL